VDGINSHIYLNTTCLRITFILFISGGLYPVKWFNNNSNKKKQFLFHYINFKKYFFTNSIPKFVRL
jgi:hypothetical protein